MTRRCLLVALVLASTAQAGALDREAVVREMLARSRLLEDAQFRVPIPLWRKYIAETAAGDVGKPPTPVPLIAEEGRYELTVGADNAVTLSATVRLHIFDPHGFGSVAVLTAALAWEDVEVNGQPAELANVDGWLRFAPAEAGPVEITARVPLKAGESHGGRLQVAIPRTVRTLARFESPGAWQAAVSGESRPIRGDDARGTHGQVAVSPCGQLDVAWERPRAPIERPPRFQLSGNVAWNIDAGVQRVTAQLDVAIGGGRAEQIVLTFPSGADRVTLSGPDVREAQVNGGSVTAFLRGRIAEQTRLRLTFEMPLAKAGLQRLSGLAVRDGRWADGTLVVTNTAGGSEVLTEGLSGLREIALAEVPAAASAMLAGPPVVACAITSAQWSAEVDVVNLGEIALRESIADLAHYQVSFRGDGTLVCKALYEIRNRTRQFLRLDLPRDSTVLLARVNDKPTLLTPVIGDDDAWLLPLVRSQASVKGLVTFPVEVVLMCRVSALTRRGQAALPLPRIDLPIAYAWCEAYVPDDMHVSKWRGPLRRVEQYSSETATATLGYGRGLAAEGYKPMEKPVTADKPPPPEKKPKPEEEPPKPTTPSEKRLGSVVTRWFGKGKDTSKPAKPVGAPTAPAAKSPVPQPAEPTPEPPVSLTSPGDSSLRLARNYWRAGKDFYEQNDYDNAVVNLENAIKLNPKSNEADNASRLLSNIRMAQGQLKLRSRAEKIAGAQVGKAQATARFEQEEQQRVLIEQGLQLSRLGRHDDAKAKLEAATSLSGVLLRQGATAQDQEARLRTVREELGKLQERETTEARELLHKVAALKGKGDYQAALETAQKLRKFEGEAGGRISFELQDLTVRAAEQKAREGQVKALEERAKELRRAVELTDERLAEWGEGRKKGGEAAIDAADRGIDRDDITNYADSLRLDVRKLEEHHTEQTLELGRRYLNAKGTANAEGLFRKVLELDPGNREARSGLAHALRLKGDEAGAAALEGRERRDEESRLSVKRDPSPAGATRQRAAAAEQEREQALKEVDKLSNDLKQYKTLLGDLKQARPDLYRTLARGKTLDTGRSRVREDKAELDRRRVPLFYGQPPRPEQRIRKAKEDTEIALRVIRGLADDASRYTSLLGSLREQRPDIYSEVIRKDVVQPKKGIRAKVTAVDPRLGLAVINAGQRRDVRKGYEFIVFRGSQYIGKLVVDEVFPDVAATHYSRPDMREDVAVGDDVTTKLAVDFGDDEGPRPEGEREKDDKPRPRRRSLWGRLTGRRHKAPAVEDPGIADGQAPLRDPRAGTVRGIVSGRRSAPRLTEDLERPEVVEDMPVRPRPPRRPDGGHAFLGTLPGTKGPVRMYDVTDLAIDRSKLEGKWKTESKDALGKDLFGEQPSDTDEDGDKLSGEKLTEFIKRSVAPGTWADGKEGQGRPNTLLFTNGRIVVRGSSEVQKQVDEFIRGFRQARGPQVQFGANIAQQRAQGQVGGGLAGPTTGGGKPGGASRGEVERFVRENYGWAFQPSQQGGQRVRTGQTFTVTTMDELIGFNADQLYTNRGQKVNVSSINLDLAASPANQLGASFVMGNNGVRYALIDEAQFRTLRELDARKSGRAVAANPTRQDAIVGTGALIANEWVANVRFAADRGNTIDVNGNPIALRHEQYILIDNGSFLTAVRAGEMQHWTVKAKPVAFAEVPQDIGVPRVGRMLRFEKTLVEPTDELAIKASYTWKGDGR